MMQCVDPVVGKILAGWLYDISGITPEMRVDYEAHLTSCEFCRSRQRLHRTIDVALIVLASVSAMIFLLAYGVIRYFGPRNAFILEIAAGAGFLLSILLWLIVAVSTPAPPEPAWSTTSFLRRCANAFRKSCGCASADSER